MTEAFEIGVSLALQDGVSDAIGKARGDVAALERAVRESGVSLRSLRDVGARAASVAFAEPRAEVAAGPSRPALQEAPPRVEAEVAVPDVLSAAVPRAETDVAPRVVVDAGSEPGAPLLGGVDTAPDVAASPEIQAPLPAVASKADEPALRLSPEVRSEPAGGFAESLVQAPVAVAPGLPPGPQQESVGQVSAPLVVAAASAAVDDTGEDASGAAAYVAQSQRMAEAAPQARLGAMALPDQPAAPAAWQTEVTPEEVPAAGQDLVPSGQTQGLARHITLLSALHLSGGSAAVAQNETATAATPEEAAVAPDGAGDEDAAPVAAATAPVGAPVAAATGAQAQKSSQQTARNETGPNEGDVFLDGMLVGRWMSRFLNREAERASAGPTGFDARRGRLLPGVTVGG